MVSTGQDAADRLLEPALQIAVLEPSSAEEARKAEGAMMRSRDALEEEYK